MLLLLLVVVVLGVVVGLGTLERLRDPLLKKERDKEPEEPVGEIGLLSADTDKGEMGVVAEEEGDKTEEFADGRVGKEVLVPTSLSLLLDSSFSGSSWVVITFEEDPREGSLSLSLSLSFSFSLSLSLSFSPTDFSAMVLLRSRWDLLLLVEVSLWNSFKAGSSFLSDFLLFLSKSWSLARSDGGI